MSYSAAFRVVEADNASNKTSIEILDIASERGYLEFCGTKNMKYIEFKNKEFHVGIV